jgi:hypothetical protein
MNKEDFLQESKTSSKMKKNTKISYENEHLRKKNRWRAIKIVGTRKKGVGACEKADGTQENDVGASEKCQILCKKSSEIAQK